MATAQEFGAFRVELLAAHHHCQAFDCGEESLNLYLQRYARQNAERNLGRTYVLVYENEPAIIAGYFTLSNSAIARASLPANVNLPNYPVPSCLLARLAVSAAHQGRGLGYALLESVFALVGDLSNQSGVYAIEVHALHERARAFYERFGFAPLTDDALHLYLPVATLRLR